MPEDRTTARLCAEIRNRKDHVHTFNNSRARRAEQRARTAQRPVEGATVRVQMPGREDWVTAKFVRRIDGGGPFAIVEIEGKNVMFVMERIDAA